MTGRTARIAATDVTVGDTIMWPNGSSLTVETITRDGDFIDWAGKHTDYSSLGNEARPGVGSALAGDEVTVSRR